jgi:hypothetical protein
MVALNAELFRDRSQDGLSKLADANAERLTHQIFSQKPP